MIPRIVRGVEKTDLHPFLLEERGEDRNRRRHHVHHVEIWIHEQHPELSLTSLPRRGRQPYLDLAAVHGSLLRRSRVAHREDDFASTPCPPCADHVRCRRFSISRKPGRLFTTNQHKYGIARRPRAVTTPCQKRHVADDMLLRSISSR